LGQQSSRRGSRGLDGPRGVRGGFGDTGGLGTRRTPGCGDCGGSGGDAGTPGRGDTGMRGAWDAGTPWMWGREGLGGVGDLGTPGNVGTLGSRGWQPGVCRGLCRATLGPGLPGPLGTHGCCQPPGHRPAVGIPPCGVASRRGAGDIFLPPPWPPRCQSPALSVSPPVPSPASPCPGTGHRARHRPLYSPGPGRRMGETRGYWGRVGAGWARRGCRHRDSVGTAMMRHRGGTGVVWARAEKR